MLVTNHTYESMSLYGGKQMSGGSGLQYSASTIIYLSKSKEKDAAGKEVVDAEYFVPLVDQTVTQVRP
jgi:hypothetical protein